MQKQFPKQTRRVPAATKNRPRCCTHPIRICGLVRRPVDRLSTTHAKQTGPLPKPCHPGYDLTGTLQQSWQRARRKEDGRRLSDCMITARMNIRGGCGAEEMEDCSYSAYNSAPGSAWMSVCSRLTFNTTDCLRTFKSLKGKKSKQKKKLHGIKLLKREKIHAGWTVFVVYRFAKASLWSIFRKKKEKPYNFVGIKFPDPDLIKTELMWENLTFFHRENLTFSTLWLSRSFQMVDSI